MERPGETTVSYLLPILPLTFIETNAPMPTSPTLRTGITGVCALTAASGAASKKPMQPPITPGRISLASINRKVFESRTAIHTPINPPKIAPINSPVWFTDAPSTDPRTAAAPVEPETNKTSSIAFNRDPLHERMRSVSGVSANGSPRSRPQNQEHTNRIQSGAQKMPQSGCPGLPHRGTGDPTG